MSKILVIVESPTKAKTISKYLGSNYKVLSSFGHIRDLPKSKIGVDTDHNFKPTYTIPTKAKKKVSELKKALKEADEVLLATDEDREGEAIAWHLAEILKLKGDKVKRISFHEITKTAIKKALENPRKLDMDLVNAQQTRRILDRLVGYKLSPFLWQKVRRGLSAGRVQSVAMRLIVDRERERMAFKVDEYWTVDSEFEKEKIIFPAKLIKIADKKVEKLGIQTETEAKKITNDIEGSTFNVTSVTKKQVSKSPPKPYTTSTLQIDANNKLGYSSKQTMMLAQRLYETGRITYMRTDSVSLADKFLNETQEYVKTNLGSEYAVGVNRYKTKSKGAQEAHEAIRPTDVSAHPDTMQATLEPQEHKIYELIWRRTVASQLPSAKLNRTAVDLNAKHYTFRANGSSIAFDGFMKVYQPSKSKILPALNEGDNVDATHVTANQHFTEPPARYSDATLVKILEEYGIGRPSTYAPTISTIIDRGYVERDDNKKLSPTDIAMIVSDLLVEHFQNIVNYEFTAELEQTLDNIAEGKVEWVPMLEGFYKPFEKNLEEKSKELNREDIMPDKELGTDKETGLPIMLRSGRFGAFIQIGEYTKEDKEAGKPKPKSASLLKGMHFESVTLEDAIQCLSFPKDLGDSGDGNHVIVAIGRFGPYLKCGDTTASINKDYNPATIDLETSKIVIKEAAERKKKMETPIAELGDDPTTKTPILVKHGRYGPYVTDGETNATIKKDIDPETITKEMAIEILIKKRAAPKRTKYKKKK